MTHLARRMLRGALAALGLSAALPLCGMALYAAPGDGRLWAHWRDGALFLLAAYAVLGLPFHYWALRRGEGGYEQYLTAGAAGGMAAGGIMTALMLRDSHAALADPVTLSVLFLVTIYAGAGGVCGSAFWACAVSRARWPLLLCGLFCALLGGLSLWRHYG